MLAMSIVHMQLIFFFISLGFAAFFAFLETSFTALRLFKIKELQARLAKYSLLFTTWEKHPQKILITILIANNFAHVLSSVLITEIMQKLIGASRGLPIGIGLATILILVFGEVIPKSWAKAQHERFLASSIWFLNSLFLILHPLTNVLVAISHFFYSGLNSDGESKEKDEMVTEQEIEFLIDYSDEQGLMETEKSEMLQNVFDLGNKQVSEIIIPKTEMVLIDVGTSLEKAMGVLVQYRYSRLPVYAEKEDNIIGIIYQKDIFALLSKKESKPLQELVRPVLFIPETKKINQLLKEFLEKRIHMAIVVDEYGIVTGLVTLEDILEEIVGDIRDEDERIQSLVVPLERGGWLVESRVSLENLSKILSITFEVTDSVTLSGFLSEKLQHVPNKGERFFYKGYCFQIQQASRRRVFQVLIFKENMEPTTES